MTKFDSNTMIAVREIWEEVIELYQDKGPFEEEEKECLKNQICDMLKKYLLPYMSEDKIYFMVENQLDIIEKYDPEWGKNYV